jgi:hypothetical protein
MIKPQSILDLIRSIDLPAQFSQNRVPLVIAGITASLGIAGIMVLSSATGVDLSDLTRDAVAVTDTHLYVGALSTTGIMLWAATAGICLLGAGILSGLPQHRSAAWFLLAAGALTAMLGFDDAFLLHERVFPTHFGLPQKGVYLVYISMVLGFLLFFFRRILRTDYVLLGMSLLFMALSVGMDEFIPYSRFETFVEDSCKFVGIVFWLTYFGWTANKLVRNTFLAAGSNA